MGSSTKKHKKERDREVTKKRKHKSRSRSPVYSPEYDREVQQYSSSSTSRHRHHRSGSAESPAPERISYETSSRERERDREKRSGHHRHHHHHKRHKERKHKNRANSEERNNQTIVIEDYHSDSSDVVEVPIAPPAPVISRQPVVVRERPRSPSPIPENGAGDCLSIAETNKLRAKLGLKPLEVESSAPVRKSPDKRNEEGLKSFKDEWGEFLHKPAANIAEKKEAQKIREKLKEKREKRNLEDKLRRLKTLGESDEEQDVDDLSKWVDRNKKKDQQKREAERRAKMLEEMDAEFGVGNVVDAERQRSRNQAYKDRDLKGLRVEHDMDEFAEGKTVILTLKDKGVLDEDGDALINVNLVDEQRYKKNVENRKQKPNMYGYNVYEEQMDEYGNPIDRSILEKYDSEIGGDKSKSFTIGENLEEERDHRRKLLEIRTKLAGKRLESLDVNLLTLALDTYTESEMTKFKKPKKKVKKHRQKLKPDDLLPLAGGGESRHNDLGRRNRGGAVSTVVTDDMPDNLDDLSQIKVEEENEDDLERVLSKARKLKQKESIIQKSLTIDPNDIKPEIKTELDTDETMAADTKDGGHIVLNATAEFCRTLGDIPTYGMAGNREEDSNDMMDFELETAETDAMDDEVPVPSTGTWNSVNPDTAAKVTSEDISNEISDIAILDEEPDVGEGVAAALRLAMSKGYLEKDDKNRPSNSRMAHLQAKNYSIEDKTYADEDKFGRRDRYHSGPIMEFRERETFKPNVKLEYIDDGGRVLNAKEAFRYLSHKFHGKGPGKNKIEKRLKKMEQDGLMMKMSSTDTPLGTLSMLQQKQKETQAPYVVLSGGKQNHANTSIAKHK